MAEQKSAPAQQPAAWRWNTLGDQSWRVSIDRPVHTNLTAFDKIEPLYLACLTPAGTDIVNDLAKTIWLAGFERAFSRTPTDPWENQSDSAREPHLNTARKIIEAGFVLRGATHD